MRGWVAKALTRCGEVVSQLHKLWVNSDNVPLSFYTWLWAHTHNWKLRWKLKFPMTVGSTLRQRWNCFMNKCFLRVNSSRKTRKHLEMSSSFVSFCLQFLTQFLLTPLCVPVYRIPGRLTVKAKKKKKTFFFPQVETCCSLAVQIKADLPSRVCCCFQFQNPLQYFLVTHFFPSHLCSKTC